MTRALLFFLLFAPLAAGAAVAAQNLQALNGLRPGNWQESTIGGNVAPRNICLAAAPDLLTGGRPAARCQMTVLNDTVNASVITWKCPGGASGRTALRRDAAGVYTVDIQGVEAGLPFASHAEWRRSGDC